MLRIDGYLIDAEIESEIMMDGEVTDHEVEVGSDFTDHIDNRPISFTVTGVVSNTPTGEVAAERGFDGSPGFNAAREAYEFLKELRREKRVVTIISQLDVFKNMATLNVTIPSNVDIGDSFRFRATFKQIETVSNDRTTIPVAVPQASRRARRGKKSAVDAPTPAEQAALNSPALFPGLPQDPQTGLPNISMSGETNDNLEEYRNTYLRGIGKPPSGSGATGTYETTPIVGQPGPSEL